MYMYIHMCVIVIFGPFRSFPIQQVKSLARCSREELQSSMKSQLTHQQHRTRRKGSYTPCTEGNLQSAPTTQKWDSKPMVHPAHWPTAQCKQSEKGTHALSARTAPRVLRGYCLL